MRRAARFGQGWYSFNRLPADLDEPLAQLDAALAEHGRSRADLEVTVCPYFNRIGPAEIEGYRERGVDRVVVLCLAFDETSMLQQLDDLVTSALHPAGG
jgi:alkanesulfonate monooxygenase SsuD/methylene tetrahydromethanopterin reductase-like flavin-dependent oxidoreductase (luciferase family)